MPNIIVLVKQVPDTNAKIVVSGDRVDLSTVKMVMSPYDEFALEAALRHKEAAGGNVTALTMGGPGADKALKDYESSLAEARAEAEKMIEQTKAEQVRLAADLKAKSEAELNQMRDSAKRNIEAAKRAAIADLYRESAQLAVKIAEKILEREVNAADHSRLIDETLAEVTSEYAGASA